MSTKNTREEFDQWAADTESFLLHDLANPEPSVLKGFLERVRQDEKIKQFGVQLASIRPPQRISRDTFVLNTTGGVEIKRVYRINGLWIHMADRVLGDVMHFYCYDGGRNMYFHAQQFFNLSSEELAVIFANAS